MSRPSSVVGSIGLRSQPIRSTTSSGASNGGTPPCQTSTKLNGESSGPNAAAVLLVAEAVEAEVEPRTRADLQHAQREAGLRGDGQEPADERGRTEHLVRLRRPCQGVEDLRGRRLEQSPGATATRSSASPSPPTDGKWRASSGARPPSTSRCTPPSTRSPYTVSNGSAACGASSAKTGPPSRRVGRHQVAHLAVELRPHRAAADRLDVEPARDRGARVERLGRAHARLLTTGVPTPAGRTRRGRVPVRPRHRRPSPSTSRASRRRLRRRRAAARSSARASGRAVTASTSRCSRIPALPRRPTMRVAPTKRSSSNPRSRTSTCELADDDGERTRCARASATAARGATRRTRCAAR